MDLVEAENNQGLLRGGKRDYRLLFRQLLAAVICLAALLLISGCAAYTTADYGYYGYYGGPGYVEYGVEPYVPVPDIYVFGGYGYPHRYYAHDFSHRGWESRWAAGPPAHVGGFRGSFHGSGHGSQRHR